MDGADFWLSEKNVIERQVPARVKLFSVLKDFDKNFEFFGPFRLERLKIRNVKQQRKAVRFIHSPNAARFQMPQNVIECIPIPAPNSR
jgi:hypothetical protein